MKREPWPKSPPELEERFRAVVSDIDGVEQRKMFGYLAAFVGGNLVTSLHQASWIVRLPTDQLQERLDAGWSGFEPMPGRPMRGYVALPDAVAAEPAAAGEWVERAVAYGRGLPPKPAKKG